MNCPTDWLHRSGIYGVDTNYDVWDLKREIRVYTENFTGEYSIQDILEEAVYWNNDPDESRYDIEDFLTDIDNMEALKEAEGLHEKVN